MKIKKAVDKIKKSLKGDKLVLFLHEENELQRKLDFCKNRLSIYFTALLFVFGWIISIIYQFVDIGLVDKSLMMSNISKNIFSGKIIVTTLIEIVAVAGIAKDVFLFRILKEDYKALIKRWMVISNG